MEASCVFPGQELPSPDRPVRVSNEMHGTPASAGVVRWTMFPKFRNIPIRLRCQAPQDALMNIGSA